MKKKSVVEICAILAIAIAVTAAGCLNSEQKEELKNAAHTAILEYVETEGKEKAIEYIDQLVADGKLGAGNAEKLKEAGSNAWAHQLEDVSQGLQKSVAVLQGKVEYEKRSIKEYFAAFGQMLLAHRQDIYHAAEILALGYILGRIL